MTILVTKYLRLGGGCSRAHSPVMVSNLSRPEMDELMKYLKGIGFHSFISGNETELVIYKATTKRSGFLGLKTDEVYTPCEIDEVLPHIEACFPALKVEVGEIQGYISDD